ncbi:TauD-domain-containing protein [Choiromyces venosus 120613-1]|uniref:TauD-domain-containing protein n=1 Tax=Choiromyces venosus 120613-1 TaxID=1336337 RepID=A0A3N4JFS0_9PEZI|nr:TauD-domain-containing protein [Choiromyces venosus 120613-1]
MAPSVVENAVPARANDIPNSKGTSLKKAPRFTPGSTVVGETTDYKYEYLKPSFPNLSWPPLEQVPYSDKGLLGDPEYKDLLAEATDVFDYNPKIGTEVHGVNLKTLTDARKNDLARLVAYRGVVFFRDQKDFEVEDQLALGRYWGPLHKHATTSVPRKEGLDEVHVVYHDGNSLDQRALFAPAYLWHADVTYEIQPPSYTILKVLHGPPRGGGGDTLWSSQYAAYDVLSAPMQKYLEGLTALHSAEEQAIGSRAIGRPVRREPVITEHPLVRTHPVTGWKSLFVNPGFVKQIVGVPKMESDAILKYLNDIVVSTQELHVRFRWEEGTVAIWDNRTCNHTATYGFSPHMRHAIRVTPHGERPVFDPNSKSQEEDLDAKTGRMPVNKNGARQSNYND